MKSVSQLKRILKLHEAELKDRYDVKTLGIFGSYVRRESMRKSDCDILIEFSKTPGLLRYIELEEYLSNLLGVKVDLVMRSALKPNIGQQILREVTYI